MYFLSVFALDETPEFGQFMRDVSAKIKEKTGETGKNIIIIIIQNKNDESINWDNIKMIKWESSGVEASNR